MTLMHQKLNACLKDYWSERTRTSADVDEEGGAMVCYCLRSCLGCLFLKYSLLLIP